MNKTTCIISFLIAVIFVSCGPTRQGAIELNNTIVADQKQILEKENKLIAAFNNTNSDRKTVEAAYKELLNLLNSLQKKYADMKPFDNKDTFRKAMIELINTYKSITVNEYKEMIDISFEKYDEAANLKWKSLVKSLNDKAGSANDRWLTAQKEFSKQYKFDIQLEQ